MKLVIAIVNNDDAALVGDELMKKGFPTTKMSSTGGFLSVENTTFLVGVDEEKVDNVIEIISDNTSRRMQLVLDNEHNSADAVKKNIQVTVGGATVFVVDVDRFIKM